MLREDFLADIATEIELKRDSFPCKTFIATFSFQAKGKSMEELGRKIWPDECEHIQHWKKDGGYIDNRIKSHLTDIYQRLVKKYNLDLPDVRKREFCYEWLWTTKYISAGKSPSHFYIPCQAELERALEILTVASGFVRIKSPHRMGKTSLLEGILSNAEKGDLRAVKIDLQSAEHKTLQNLGRFSQWFCQQIVSKLGLPIDVAQSWISDSGSDLNCQNFFRNDLLKLAEQPLLLGVDNLDVIFEYPETADDFLGMLRSWIEDKSHPWEQLRVAIVYTWHYKTKLHHKSPLNIGEEINLPDLTISQIEELVRLHDLDWNGREISSLTRLIGQHPYLIESALYELANDDELTLRVFLARACAADSIYTNYLRRQIDYLNQDRQLADLMSKIVESPVPFPAAGIRTNSDSRYYSTNEKLQDLGLIKNQNGLVPKSELLKRYFAEHLLAGDMK